MFGKRMAGMRSAATKPHPPRSALEKGLVKLAQQHDLKTISATKNKPVRRK